MATENAESGFIKDAEPQPITEKEEKKIGSTKRKEKITIENFITNVEEERK
jgi:hypothetical protein